MPALGEGAELMVEDALYGADLDEVIERIGIVDHAVTSLMVVGHNPTLHEVAFELSDPNDQAGRNVLEDFPTCALVAIETLVEHWDELSPGCGRVVHHFYPDGR